MFFLQHKIDSESRNAYGYGFLRNRAEISSGTVTGITATVRKKVRNRAG